MQYRVLELQPYGPHTLRSEHQSQERASAAAWKVRKQLEKEGNFNSVLTQQYVDGRWVDVAEPYVA